MKDKDNKDRLIIYQGPAGDVAVRLDAGQETVLLTQQQVAQLFNVQKAAISKHVNNIFDSGELDKNSTVSVLETVQTEGIWGQIHNPDFKGVEFKTFKEQAG